MAIKDSGSSLAISEIVAEFGDAAGGSDSLSEYYAGGQNVPSGATGESGSIPTSGTISMSQFYGSTARIAIALQISSTTQNYNIYSNRGGTYSAGISDVTLTVQAIVGSAGTGQYAIDTGNQWTSGDTVKIINNSQIVGAGGAGGAGGQGGNGNQALNGQAGGAGGSAINLGIDTTIQNDGGRIRGAGGGGGGGGNSGTDATMKGQTTFHTASGGGGGGGTGQAGGAAGAAGQAGSASGEDAVGQAGQAGSISSNGAGGGGTTAQASADSGDGGAGGSFGGAGQAGQNGQGPQRNGSGGAGGAAGKAINLNGNSVTYEDGSSNIDGAVS
jgi:hypothetical protein